MSTESSYQPEMVDQTRQQIRGLVQEIENLARTEVTPEEFYEGFLHRVIAALAAIGGAVWTLDEEGRLSLSAQINLAETHFARKPGRSTAPTVSCSEKFSPADKAPSFSRAMSTPKTTRPTPPMRFWSWVF